MQSNWEKSFDEVMRSEGGYVLTGIYGDLGGQTYAGIARNPNPNWEGWELVDKGVMPEIPMVKNFYKKIWNTVKGDDLPSGVDYLVYDFAVNAGAGQSAKFLQRAVGVPDDGGIGPITLAAVKGKDAKELIDAFTEQKEAFYNLIVKNRPEQSKFLLGWMNRVNHSKRIALSMLGDNNGE